MHSIRKYNLKRVLLWRSPISVSFRVGKKVRLRYPCTFISRLERSDNFVQSVQSDESDINPSSMTTTGKLEKKLHLDSQKCVLSIEGKI